MSRARGAGRAAGSHGNNSTRVGNCTAGERASLPCPHIHNLDRLTPAHPPTPTRVAEDDGLVDGELGKQRVEAVHLLALLHKGIVLRGGEERPAGVRWGTWRATRRAGEGCRAMLAAGRAGRQAGWPGRAAASPLPTHLADTLERELLHEVDDVGLAQELVLELLHSDGEGGAAGEGRGAGRAGGDPTRRQCVRTRGREGGGHGQGLACTLRAQGKDPT